MIKVNPKVVDQNKSFEMEMDLSLPEENLREKEVTKVKWDKKIAVDKIVFVVEKDQLQVQEENSENHLLQEGENTFYIPTKKHHLQKWKETYQRENRFLKQKLNLQKA